MARSMHGRVGLVTGGGSGLGRATALRLARGGMTVVVADIDADRAGGSVEQIVAGGGSAEAVTLDVTDPESVRTVVGDIATRYAERFDCLINNAGTDVGAGLIDITDEQWHRVIAVNQSGPLFTSREFMRAVLARAPGDYPPIW